MHVKLWKIISLCLFTRSAGVMIRHEFPTGATEATAALFKAACWGRCGASPFRPFRPFPLGRSIASAIMYPKATSTKPLHLARCMKPYRPDTALHHRESGLWDFLSHYPSCAVQHNRPPVVIVPIVPFRVDWHFALKPRDLVNGLLNVCVHPYALPIILRSTHVPVPGACARYKTVHFCSGELFAQPPHKARIED